MATDLDPSGNDVQIDGVTLRTQGLTGTAEVRSVSQGRMRDSGLPITDNLATALERENVELTRAIELRDVADVGGPAPTTRSAPGGGPGIEIVVPHPGPSYGQVLLQTDESNVTTWHFARDSNNRVDTARDSATQTFVLPRQVSPSGSTEGQVRGLIGSVGIKLLTLLVFPLIDPFVGPVADGFAHSWETKNRPYRIRSFTDQDYASPPNAPNVHDPDWKLLAQGPVLIMIHGTFSQAHTGFAGLSSAFVTQLNDRYQNRVIAFDHFTLSEDPTDNVRWFLKQMPPNLTLEADIVCHSRGGLVARVFTEKAQSLATDGRAINVKNLVFVAAPNAGTILTDSKYMNDYVDVYTNVLNFFPDNGVTEIFQAIITVVKHLAVDALNGLPGLQSMLPGGKYLSGFLNVGGKGNTNYFALASDYEPTQLGLQLLHARLAGTIFGEANDLIVPTKGVYDTNAAGFPIDQRYVFVKPDEVQHSGYFSQAKAQNQIANWLP